MQVDLSGAVTGMVVIACLVAILLLIVGLARVAFRIAVFVVVVIIAFSLLGGSLSALAPGSGGSPSASFQVAASPDGGWDVTIPPVADATEYRVYLDDVRVATQGEPGMTHVDAPAVDGEQYLPAPVRDFKLVVQTKEGRTADELLWCAPVVFLSARGTYEDKGEAKFGHGIGSRGWRTWMYLAQQLGVSPSRGGVLPTVVGASPVRYPATVVAKSAASYSESRDKGVANLSKQIRSVRAGCPDSRIVLFGYSQGADVVASVWQDDATHPESFLGVVSFADPHFNRRWTQQMTVLPEKGSWSKDGLLGKRSKFDQSEIEGLQVWCLPGDPVCQARPTLINWHGWEYDCYEVWAAYYLAQDIAPFLADQGWEVKEPGRPRCIPAIKKSKDNNQSYEPDPLENVA